jgi:hypothetical protein
LSTTPTTNQTDVLNGNTTKQQDPIPCKSTTGTTTNDNGTNGIYPYCQLPRKQSLDLSFQMDFNTLTTNSAEHAWVPQTWRQMLDTDRLDGNTLGARDSSTHPTWQRDGFGPLGWQGNHGRLFTNNQYSTLSSKEQGDGVVNKLEYKDKDPITNIISKKQIQKQ